MIKKIIVAALFVPAFFACNNSGEEKNPLADSLATVNGGLQTQVVSKDSAIDAFVNSFNEIQDNLNQIKEKEKIVSINSKGGDVKSKEQEIKDDIQLIYDLMNKNKQRIASMKGNLKNANVKIEGLEKMIETLNAQLEEKDVQIGDLKAQVEKLNIALNDLNLNYEEVKKESSDKTTELQTAYYALGTSKELKEKGVITKEGGFIGIGKSTKMLQDFNKSYFTQVDIAQLTYININAKKAKLLSSHPSNSYKMVGTDKKVERLDITNAKEFWSASKYCLIVIE